MKTLEFIKNWFIWFITPFLVLSALFLIIWLSLAFINWDFNILKVLTHFYNYLNNTATMFRILLLIWIWGSAVCTSNYGKCRFYGNA